MGNLQTNPYIQETISKCKINLANLLVTEINEKDTVISVSFSKPKRGVHSKRIQIEDYSLLCSTSNKAGRKELLQLLQQTINDVQPQDAFLQQFTVCYSLIETHIREMDLSPCSVTQDTLPLVNMNVQVSNCLIDKIALYMSTQPDIMIIVTNDLNNIPSSSTISNSTNGSDSTLLTIIVMGASLVGVGIVAYSVYYYYKKLKLSNASPPSYSSHVRSQNKK